jgi:hypothetical protein
MKLIYSYLSLPKKDKYGTIYTMRNGGVYYNLVLAGYIPKINKKFGVEISGLCINDKDYQKYASNEKFSIIKYKKRTYLIEACLHNCTKPPKQHHSFYYRHFDLPKHVYNSFIKKINELSKKYE